jgi:hypothetical protein
MTELTSLITNRNLCKSVPVIACLGKRFYEVFVKTHYNIVYWTDTEHVDNAVANCHVDNAVANCHL